MVMIFIIGGLAGQSLVTNPCFATLPISLIVLGSMLSANPLSLIMQKYGRRAGFLIGTLGGASGGIIGCIGLYLSDFPIFLIGSFLSGIYMSAQGFYRFAATDTASPDFKPKAISYVMAGGLISAIIGPQLVKVTSSSFVIPFLGTYVTVILLNLVGAFLFLYLKIPPPRTERDNRYESRSYSQILKTPELLVAIICAMVAYALMNLVMTSTPLAVVGCGFTENIRKTNRSLSSSDLTRHLPKLSHRLRYEKFPRNYSHVFSLAFGLRSLSKDNLQRRSCNESTFILTPPHIRLAVIAQNIRQVTE